MNDVWCLKMIYIPLLLSRRHDESKNIITVSNRAIVWRNHNK